MKYIVLQENDDFYLMYPYQKKDEPKFEPHVQNDYLFIVSKKKNEIGDMIQYNEIGICWSISDFDLSDYIKRNKIKPQMMMGGIYHYSVNFNSLVFCLDYKELNKGKMERFNSLQK